MMVFKILEGNRGRVVYDGRNTIRLNDFVFDFGDGFVEILSDGCRAKINFEFGVVRPCAGMEAVFGTDAVLIMKNKLFNKLVKLGELVVAWRGDRELAEVIAFLHGFERGAGFVCTMEHRR